MSTKIKVFRMNDYEWWAGESLEACKKTYLDETGVPEEEAFMDEGEVSESEMKRLKFTADGGSYWVPIKKGTYTFKQVLNKLVKAKVKFPCLFAVSSDC